MSSEEGNDDEVSGSSIDSYTNHHRTTIARRRSRRSMNQSVASDDSLAQALLNSSIDSETNMDSDE